MGVGDNSSSRLGRSAFALEVVRSIRTSLGRFLAIMGIVALGCGFFAGLQMSGADMRTAADRYYDETRLWDLRVISTLGFEDSDVQGMADIEGISAAMPSRTVDAMVRMGDTQVAARVSSLDVEAARADAAGADDGTRSYLNRLELREGSWPIKPDECVISADVTDSTAAIGDTIEVLYGSSSLDEELEVRAFTVVGTVSSSNYPYISSFGSTNLGAGTIDQYLYVTDGAFFSGAPYTEVYLKVAGADELESESDAYESLVGEVKGRIETREGEIAASRQDELKAAAQEKLDDKVVEYNQQHDEAYSSLDDARAQLDAAASQISEGEGRLAQGEREYEDGLAAYQSQKTSVEQQLSSGEAQWQAGVDELLAGLASSGIQAGSLAEARPAVEASLSALDGGISQLQRLLSAFDTVDQLNQAVVGLDLQIAEFRQQMDELEAVPGSPETEAQLEALRAALVEAQAARAAAQEGLDQASAAAASSGMTRETAQDQLSQLQEQQTKLQGVLGGISQLQASRARLDEARSTARSQLDGAKAQLDAAASTLVSSRQELSDARESYAEGLAAYESGRAEADERFFAAWAQIEDAQDQIDQIEPPDIYALDRAQSEGAATYHADTERMDSIAGVFPLIFFLVAALVSLTTMTRMVEDDRIQIGTYKALGYGTARIASKYLLYAALAGGMGALVGIVVLSQVLPYIIMVAYAIIYVVPLMDFPLPVNLPTALLSGGLGVGVTLLATWAAVVSSLKEAPATLMLPRAPKAGRRILLERLGPVWRHLSFSWKVTCRNLFRYKRRFLMTVIGISGCTALLLVGFGLHDSIWDIIDRQFGPIVHYDTTIGLGDNANELDVSSVVDFLESTGEVSDIVRVQRESMQASDTGSASGATKTTPVSVVVAQSAQDLSAAITFCNRLRGEGIAFDDGSVLVTEKLASLYGLAAGDQILVFDQDDVGNAVGEGHALTITGVVENYVGNSVYVGRGAWEGVGGTSPVFSTIYAKVTQDEAAREGISSTLHDMTDVSTVIFSEETIDMYRTMLSAVDMIVVVLIVSAAALAFIVLYNLTNINVEERVREIASLKVLGFTCREVYAYIFREIALLAVIGDVVGLSLGVWLENFVVTTAEVDYVMFGRLIHPASFAFAFALTLAFSALVMLVMRRKLDHVNMVESLKSVD